jgi:hypothetical protein
MAKWSGIIGYVKIEEIEKGLWSDGIVTEHVHFGDMISNRNKIQSSPNSTNSDITLMNNISIVADNFAIENFGHMKYAVVNGMKWKITDVLVQYPRLILTIGGLYNGK